MPPRPNVIDLFSGVGGLSLGALRAGFDLSLAVELDPHAMKSHGVNFPGFKHLHEDISALNGTALLEAAGLQVGQLDGLIGGPPCQGFSIIGRQQFTDPRNNLFSKFFQLTAECRPKFFVAENVLGILHPRYDDLRAEAFSSVARDYVLLEPRRLRARDFGAPTVRERVFFIGYLRDGMENIEPAAFDAPRGVHCPNVEDALRGLPPDVKDDWLTEEQSWRRLDGDCETPETQIEFWRRVEGDIPAGVGDFTSLLRHREQREVSGCFGTRHGDVVRARFEALQPGQIDVKSKSVRLKLDGHCPTLRAGTGADKGSHQAVRPVHPTLPRVITPREAARMQGFPDWFRFAPSKWHSFRQIGNSVSPLVAEPILSAIIKQL